MRGTVSELLNADTFMTEVRRSQAVNSARSAFASFRSRVSNPSINQPCRTRVARGEWGAMGGGRPAPNRASGLRKGNIGLLAQAPERQPCSIVQFPTVKPSSVLDPA
jgi:hypothetical protein